MERVAWSDTSVKPDGHQFYLPRPSSGNDSGSNSDSDTPSTSAETVAKMFPNLHYLVHNQLEWENIFQMLRVGQYIINDPTIYTSVKDKTRDQLTPLVNKHYRRWTYVVRPRSTLSEATVVRALTKNVFEYLRVANDETNHPIHLKRVSAVKKRAMRGKLPKRSPGHRQSSWKLFGSTGELCVSPSHSGGTPSASALLSTEKLLPRRTGDDSPSVTDLLVTLERGKAVTLVAKPSSVISPPSSKNTVTVLTAPPATAPLVRSHEIDDRYVEMLVEDVIQESQVTRSMLHKRRKSSSTYYNRRASMWDDVHRSNLAASLLGSHAESLIEATQSERVDRLHRAILESLAKETSEGTEKSVRRVADSLLHKDQLKERLYNWLNMQTARSGDKKPTVWKFVSHQEKAHCVINTPSRQVGFVPRLGAGSQNRSMTIDDALLGSKKN